jgi:DNA repair exonuclease SbcCD nuclease subunit
MRSGTITESNGGGWFRVLMDDKTSRSLRAYQLQPPVPPEAHEEELRLIQTEKISVRDSIPSAVAGENALKQGGDSTPYFVEAPAAANETTDIIESMPKTVIKESASNWTILTPPPPTIFDLDAEVLALQTDPARQFDNIRYLRQVENHMSFDRWVVFTDLHCSPVTLDTCIRVLDRIHEIAVERQAGILFLGDFWHHRGVLRVECLNAVLQCLSRWTQPMVLIPGNHDQVTLGGHLHSLTPLENSYRVAAVASRKSSFSAVTDTIPGPLIFSHPTKFREALFVPHIRDPAILESVLQSPASHRSAAILVHADVTGAYMNDMILSSGGVPPSMFPLSKAVYSGHFHKPHVVRSSGRTIEYLGSPYQVSLSEAQQDKSLAVLDASTGWNCVQRIPIDIGRRHFRLTSLFEFLELEASADGAIADPDPRRVRKGDRVVLVLNRTELGGDSRVNGEGSRVFDHAVSLRKSGVAVEIREVSRSPGEPMGDGNRTTAGHAEELTMESALRSFMHQEVLRAGLSNETAETLVSAGLDILDDIESDMSQLSVQPGESNSALSLQELTVEGFGPFKERLTYPLANRGLVLLRGVNLDGGSDRCVPH